MYRAKNKRLVVYIETELNKYIIDKNTEARKGQKE